MIYATQLVITSKEYTQSHRKEISNIECAFKLKGDQRYHDDITSVAV